MDTFLRAIKNREKTPLYRSLVHPHGIDFSSNDYLSFTSNKALQSKIQQEISKYFSGSTSSRLIRGSYPLIEVLEKNLAQFSGYESALFFSSGYQANIGLMSALLHKRSVVFSDEQNHASIIDGIRLSGSKKVIFPHKDLNFLESSLSLNENSEFEKFIVVESLYSMSGDLFPLLELVKLAQQYNAKIIVDEAHATGLYGSGQVSRLGLNKDILCTVHTAGKSLGCSGAWVSGNNEMKCFLVNFCRSFIYSTAPAPIVAQALLSALSYLQSNGESLAIEVLKSAQFFRDSLEGSFEFSGDSAITFINLKSSEKSVEWSNLLQAKGFDVRAIRYPTVSEGHAGLRICMHFHNNMSEVKELINELKQLGDK